MLSKWEISIGNDVRDGSQLLSPTFCLESFKILTFNIRPWKTFPFKTHNISRQKMTC